MILLNVEYLNESSEALFFNVTFEIKPLFRTPLQITKRAYLEKFTRGYSPFPYWCDNGQQVDNYSSVANEMILQYELTKKTNNYENTWRNISL